ncbi:hypothetical protein [Burkholderia anthina]|uniref:hypothetical protein n=1 Tax=Burkholderia anthina TaxID=179879 RepID=UPI0015886C16|nr:hypothetical protein [Burkholderia anthina]
MDQATRLKPLFHPGRLLITPEAHHILRLNGIPVISVVLRHIAGDWGIVSDDDKRQNDMSIAAGLRLMSIYRLPDDSRLIVVTEWDRSSTTLELLGQISAASGTRYPQWPTTNFPPKGRT